MINTYYPGTASASAGATSISIGTATGSGTAIASGDLLLVIQMQDAAINSANTDSYGDGGEAAHPPAVWTAVNNSGVYEFVVAHQCRRRGRLRSAEQAPAMVWYGLSYTKMPRGQRDAGSKRRFQVVTRAAMIQVPRSDQD